MLLSEAIRNGKLFKCPCGCGRHRTLIEALMHCDETMLTDACIADWIAEQEKRLGITEKP